MEKRTKQELEFTELLEKHKKLIFKVANIYCKNPEDRKDLIQEIIIQLWKAYPKYDSTFAITTWFYRIALNVSISYYRKAKSQKIKSVTESEYIFNIIETPEIDTNRNEQLELLYQFINELKELDKALMLLYLEEKKQDEIAIILGISKTNVATKIGRIKKQLKTKFQKIN